MNLQEKTKVRNNKTLRARRATEGGGGKESKIRRLNVAVPGG